MEGADDEGELVLYEVAEGVATLRMNRPEQLNPLTHGPGSMHRAITEAIGRANDDSQVGCIVLTGSGRAFSAGGGLVRGGGAAPQTALEWQAFQTANHQENERIRQSAKPVIGAINGLCYGAAMMMVLYLDILIAAKSARLGLIETRMGVGGADMLAYHVGPQWAKFLAITGELIGADKAREIGLVLEVIEDDRFAERAQDLGRRVAAMPRQGVRLNRQVINNAIDQMGWRAQQGFAAGSNAILNSASDRVETTDGRRLKEIMRTEGWKAWKTARDAPFEPPWLEDPS